MPMAKDGKAQRFYSRHFPPPGLYPEDELFNLALLPLLVQEGQSGFVAFNASNLQPSADIVRQLAAALRGVRLYREAVEARRLAEEANRLKSRFLSLVSHELRTPLNLISGLSDILLHESDSVGTDDLKVNKKDLRALLAPFIVSSQEIARGKNKEWQVVGRNFLGNEVTIINRKEDDCLQDLATLNGFTVE